MSDAIPQDKTRPPAILVANFQARSAGALVGFLDVTLPSGLVLHRCGIFMKDGKTWAAPPAKQVIGRDGMVQRTAEGKARYEQSVSFVDRATQARWSAGVIEAARELLPEVGT